MHLGVRVEQRFAHQFGTFASQVAEATRRLHPYFGGWIVEEDFERLCRHVGLLDRHHSPKRRASHSPGRWAFAGSQGQLAHLGGIDQPGVERQGNGAQAWRRVRHHRLLQHGAQIVGNGVGTAEKRQRGDARLFGRTFIRRNLGQNCRGLARGSHCDLVEQPHRGPPGHSVRAPQRQAYRIGRCRWRARGQVEQRRLRLPAERGVLVGESHRQNAGGSGGIEAAALPQDRAAHSKGLVGQGGAQSGGVGTLALTSINGGRHLDPAPAHVGRRIVERGSQDLIFASATGAHHGQGFQGVAT